MRQELYRPEVSEPSPAYYTRELVQPMEVTLSKEAKRRATKKSNRIARPLALVTVISLCVTHGSLPVFFFLFAVTIAVNVVAWRHFLKIEREAAANGLVLPRSLDGE